MSSDNGNVAASYQMVHEKVFAVHCIFCHGNAGGVNLESYINVKKNLSAIENVTLVVKTMPKNGVLTTSESTLLSAWIKAGAPENIAVVSQAVTLDEPLKPSFNSIKEHIIDKRC
ncbi:MAG: hypothetical protein HY072_07440, partial [Deltaproteobacteria bacterium]|nr:hypothetical protein [Deltaproteobacteria bacterium]